MRVLTMFSSLRCSSRGRACLLAIGSRGDVLLEAEPLLPGPLDCGRLHQIAAHRTVGQIVHAHGHFGTRETSHLTIVALPRLEAHCAPARNVEAEAERGLAVERQGTVDLEEVVMSADLYRPVTGIGDFDLLGFAASVDFNRSLRQLDHSGQRWF